MHVEFWLGLESKFEHLAKTNKYFDFVLKKYLPVEG
jgi:hypothetical protein